MTDQTPHRGTATSRSATAEPSSRRWSPTAQCIFALLAGLALVMLAWGSSGPSRGSTQPLPTEKEVKALPATDLNRAGQEPPPAPLRLPVRSSRKPPPAGKIDVNQASEAELCTLPGIGPVLAARIIEARQDQSFRTVDDLRQIKGIGAKTMEKIRLHVTTGPSVVER
jgi:competence protein ComEA